MCGFAGLLGEQRLRESRRDRIARMADSLRHRGPDDSGLWLDEAAGIALGFRRLSVIDLSELGHQPMLSPQGRFVLAFNGEIYNHGDLRSELIARGWHFRGQSDTETIAGAFECWGVRGAVQRFIGMFAIAAWDRQERALTLIRDRLGIKPLYYGFQDGCLLFGSELKALIAGGLRPSLDLQALGDYLRFLYVPGPATIYREVRKLAPGGMLTIRSGAAPGEPEAYWDLEEVRRRGAEAPFTGDEEEAVDELERLLNDAIRLRMYADVPLGALLSGGVDSSVVVALMQKQSSRPVQTFSIGFDSADHDETEHAAAVARHVGSEHHALRVSGADALAQVPHLAEWFDEPLANPSQIPTLLLCGLSRKHVTVALSGDGGDELFGGYNRYIAGERVLRRLTRIPHPLRRGAGRALEHVTSTHWNRAYDWLGALAKRPRPRLVGEKMAKLARLLQEQDAGSMYTSLLSVWPGSGLPYRAPGPSRLDRSAGQWQNPIEIEDMMLLDQATYLPDDLLGKVDRASMAVSLEARVPILDHRIVELSWRLPLRLKVRDASGKWVLRRVLDRHVPRTLTERPKTGFTVPLADWLRGPLRDWAEALLDGDLEPLDAAVVRDAWSRLLRGGNEMALPVWTVLTYRGWAVRWR